MLETNGRLPAVILTKTSGTIGKASVSTAIKTERPPHPTTKQQSTLQKKLNYTVEQKKGRQHNFET